MPTTLVKIGEVTDFDQIGRRNVKPGYHIIKDGRVYFMIDPAAIDTLKEHTYVQDFTTTNLTDYIGNNDITWQLLDQSLQQNYTEDALFPYPPLKPSPVVKPWEPDFTNLKNKSSVYLDFSTFQVGKRYTSFKNYGTYETWGDLEAFSIRRSNLKIAEHQGHKYVSLRPSFYTIKNNIKKMTNVHNAEFTVLFVLKTGTKGKTSGPWYRTKLFGGGLRRIELVSSEDNISLVVHDWRGDPPTWNPMTIRIPCPVDTMLVGGFTLTGQKMILFGNGHYDERNIPEYPVLTGQQYIRLSGYADFFRFINMPDTSVSMDYIQKFEGWSAKKYNISLPVGHPYKDILPINYNKEPAVTNQKT